jgi:hypothetical protein
MDEGDGFLGVHFCGAVRVPVRQPDIPKALGNIDFAVNNQRLHEPYYL